MRIGRPLGFSVLALGLLASSPARAQLDVPPEPVLPPPPTVQQQAPTPPPPQQQPTQQPAPTQPQPTPPGVTPPSTEPAPPADRYRSTVMSYRPSPEWTQDRSFTSTRFWLLDPGRYEVQTWWRTRLYDDPKANPYEFLFQQEIEIGVVPHLQLDVYENLQFVDDGSGSHELQQEGVQIEARIAIPSYYGQMFGNPVIYLEFHPRHNQPDRAEVRLLLGGAPTSWLFLVMNPYVESNVQSTDTYTVGTGGQLVKTSPFIADAEFGSTFAAGIRVTDWFRVSAEAKIGWDMLGTTNNALHFVAWAGPGFILKPFKGSNYFKIMGTCLFGITGMSNSDGAAAQRYEPLLILGSAF